MYNNIYPIIVTYNPNVDQLLTLINKLLLSTRNIVICNNSVASIELPVGYSSVKIFNFSENLGIAKAQNVGMKWAFENGAEFVLQMDQDSQPDKMMLKKLLDSFYKLTVLGEKVGLICPQDYDESSLEASKTTLLESNMSRVNGVFKVETAISSGSLIPLKTYESIGCMNNALFIDLVDSEYCWRINHHSMSVFKDVNAKLFHRLGDGTISVTRFLTLCDCASFRHYYIFRNTIYLSKSPFVPIKRKMKMILKLLLTFLAIPFYLNKPVERIKFSLKGVFDGVFGRLGPL